MVLFKSIWHKTYQTYLTRTTQHILRFKMAFLNLVGVLLQITRIMVNLFLDVLNTKKITILM